MNKKLQEFAKEFLKNGLLKCSKPQQDLFKRMYGKIEQSIEEVVAKMPESKLDWAMKQVDKTLENNKKS